MKTIEENAKVYIELINRLEDVKDAIKKHNYGIAMEILCKPYTPFQVITHSELTESEDERIRKELICFLETEIPQCNARDKYIAWLEKQGEQKPVVKVESKFKIEEGKRYVCISQFCNCIEGRVYKAVSDSRIIDDLGTEYDMHSDAYKYFRLWTIEDAKDGDVLVHSSFMFGDFIFIYNNTSILQAYCYYSCEMDRFIIEDKEHPCPWNMQEVKPATQEQRDLLFAKMKEAGYEWDAELKQLKKIEQKPVEGNKGNNGGISPNTEWSDDDNWNMQVFINALELYNNPVDKNLLKNWFKYLKERVRHQKQWKPSEAQMDAMQKALVDLCGKDEHNIITLLYYDLKKLMEE